MRRMVIPLAVLIAGIVLALVGNALVRFSSETGRTGTLLWAGGLTGVGSGLLLLLITWVQHRDLVIFGRYHPGARVWKAQRVPSLQRLIAQLNPGGVGIGSYYLLSSDDDGLHFYARPDEAPEYSLPWSRVATIEAGRIMVARAAPCIRVMTGLELGGVIFEIVLCRPESPLQAIGDPVRVEGIASDWQAHLAGRAG